MTTERRPVTRRSHPWKKGERIDHRKLNQVVEAVDRLTTGVRPPTQVGQDAIGKGALVQFYVREEFHDYITASRYTDGVLSSATVKIAKPYLLRKTPWQDGGTQTARAGITYDYTAVGARTADDGATTENQVIVPSYEVGDLIYATRGIGGGTDVLDADDKAVEWLDVNVDGRAWAKAD